MVWLINPLNAKHVYTFFICFIIRLNYSYLEWNERLNIKICKMFGLKLKKHE